MRDEFRRTTSGQFSDQMRDMRDQAQQLDQRQKEIADEMELQAESKQKTLADSGVNRELADRIGEQKNRTAELVEQMRDVSEQAESPEPLLSKKLYQTLRKASADRVDKALEVAGEPQPVIKRLKPPYDLDEIRQRVRQWYERLQAPGMPHGACALRLREPPDLYASAHIAWIRYLMRDLDLMSLA